MGRGDSGGVVEKKAAKPVTKVKTLFQNLPVDIEGNRGTLSSYVATKNYIFDEKFGYLQLYLWQPKQGFFKNQVAFVPKPNLD